MYAFRPSGEKSAAVAPAICKFTVALDEVSTTKTWLGVSTVFDTMTRLPSGATASTFPGAALMKALTLGGLPLAFRTINPRVPNRPELVPRKAFVPCRLNNNELGVAGRLIGLPTVFLQIGRATCRERV